MIVKDAAYWAYIHDLVAAAPRFTVETLDRLTVLIGPVRPRNAIRESAA